MLRILAVEDSPSMLSHIESHLTEDITGYDLRTATSSEEALAAIDAAPPDLVLLDLSIPRRADDGSPEPEHGEAVLRWIQRSRPQVPVIVLSQDGHRARDFLLEKGADDFFTKGDGSAWDKGKLPNKVDALIGHLASRSAAMQALRRELDLIREADRAILITGPAGAGRRHLARVVHSSSPRSRRPIRSLSLATSPPDELASLGADPAVGGLFVTGVDHPDTVSVDMQLALSELMADAHAPTGIALSSSLTRAELLDHEGLAPELARELRGLRCLAMPSLSERLDDVAELASCFARNAALARERAEADRGIDPDCDGPRWALSPSAHAALRLAVETGALGGECDALKQAVDRGIAQAEVELVGPRELGIELPVECAVVARRNGESEELRVSAIEADALSEDPQWELVMRAVRDGGTFRVDSIRRGADQKTLEDVRIGRLLYILAARAGEIVDTRPHKRALGLLAREPIRRYIHDLRRLLDDQEVTGRRSLFFESHYREQYSFNREVAHIIIRCLDERGPTAED